MAFDGITMKCIATELSTRLCGGRVDKIYMPDKDTIVISVRSTGKNYKLFLCANPSIPRIYLTESARENPLSPPVFCMLLRKHLSGGHITHISCPDVERVIEIGIESKNELGDIGVKRLIIEIMGRYSNILLVNENGSIADCVRKIDASAPGERILLPGVKYEFPPKQNKVSPLETDFDEIRSIVSACPDELKMDKHILNSFAGLSPAVARDFVYAACGDMDAQGMSFDDETKAILAKHIAGIFDKIKVSEFEPVIIKNDDTLPFDFSCFDLKQYDTKERVPALCEVLDDFYIEREIRQRLNQKSSEISKTVSNLLARYRKKATLQQQDIENAGQMDKYKLYGDLITANIYQINAGDTRLIAQNFYDENLPEIEIPLDANLSPAKNASKFYAKYNKLKSTAIHAARQLEITNSDIEYLMSVESSIDTCENMRDIAEIRRELEAGGYIKAQKNSEKPKKDETIVLNKFISSDGFEIYVGKTSRQNDYLTMKFARSRDIWMHTKNIPGSHTVIITGGKDVPDRTLEEAANLAAYYSKARQSSGVAVDYTEIKNVKKPSGAKPGMVIYEEYYTIYVTPDEEKVKEMSK
ncbi:MAG: NFACT family protein [Clostridia bacterium]|nr:NFACT family protein [Clostridia bacterium]